MKSLFHYLDESPSIQTRFFRFDERNPHVYRLFKRFAEEVLRAGHSHYSADAILHRIRWHLSVETVNPNPDTYKINDHFSSRYARKLMDEDERFRGFFTTRRLQS